ncbi:hypothetical protein PSV08DRAFT_387232 [Bipolaris maydis]|uniref:uncharacterized protein n=1 Tax=Cochliobolus heterostrophus TaxID=5016 RepID=UPI0024D681D3|nr:hypothetical protein J3E73DRAFT_407464 [Bipolaris maydis]KAJ5063306.1 hypothetical protein J3E74DRAFT_445801 [Bipolaris maydis]KAJ6272697.1 hypothetical protein PSV08DRAFT_387232 [Bipolaris maydis]
MGRLLLLPLPLPLAATGRRASRTPKARKSRLSERPRTASGQGGKAPPTTATANANTNPNCTEAVHQRLSPASARPHQPTDRAPSTPSALHRSVEVRSVSDTTTLTTHPFSQNAHSGRTSALLLYLCSCASQDLVQRKARRKKASSTLCPRSAVMNRRHDKDRVLADVALGCSSCYLPEYHDLRGQQTDCPGDTLRASPTNHPCPPPGGGTIDAAQMAREKSRRFRRTERILYQIATPTCNRQAWTTGRAIGVQVMHQDHSHSAGSGLARINRPLALTTYSNPLARLGQ